MVHDFQSLLIARQQLNKKSWKKFSEMRRSSPHSDVNTLRVFLKLWRATASCCCFCRHVAAFLTVTVRVWSSASAAAACSSCSTRQSTRLELSTVVLCFARHCRSEWREFQDGNSFSCSLSMLQTRGRRCQELSASPNHWARRERLEATQQQQEVIISHVCCEKEILVRKGVHNFFSLKSRKRPPAAAERE